MRRVNLRNYAEVIQCNENMIMETKYIEVATANPNDFHYKPGMISLRYHCLAEIYYNGKVIRNLVKHYPKIYYFGTFTSVSDFILENDNLKNTDLFKALNKIENVKGVVTNPEGLRIIVQENGEVIEPKIEKNKVKSKNRTIDK